LRRRSLATLRREVEPVEPVALTRFLGHWHGIGGARRGLDALVDTLGVLQGAALPASILETDLLPARVNGYRAADVDALIAAGDLVWVGAGALGPNDGRVRLFFRDQVALLLDDGAVADPPTGPVHDALRAHLRERGASFWLPLANAAAGAPGSATPQEALAALWDLVWAGEVTNDTLAPLRSFVGAKTAKALAPSARGRPRPGRLTRLGPPAGAGRWSLVSELVERRPSPTERAHARALQMLERHGVLTREAALAEGIEGGFAGVYPVLKALEERGQVRRGYFVAGLGAAQFALPGAVDRLRSCREPDADSAAMVVAATDPAQPYGAALAWPESSSRPARAAGALVVLSGGEALAYLERGGRQLVLVPAAAGDDRWVEALAALVKDGRRRSIELRMIDGEAAISSPHAAALRAVGFRDGYRGLVLRS
jgi:ATP-dependent Lhr-like helicase